MYATFILAMLLGAIVTLLAIISTTLMKIRSDLSYIHSELTGWMVEERERAHYRR